MKKLSIALVLFLFINSSIFAQVNKEGNQFPLPRVATTADALATTNGLSTYTGFLLADMLLRDKHPQNFDENAFIKKYGLVAKGGILYANCFIKRTDGFELSSLKNQGVLLGSDYGKIATALIPIHALTSIAKTTGINYIAIGTPCTLFMDSASKATNVTKVHQGQWPLSMPYKGDGVVVGMIDIGFDFNHPNFYDSTGVNNYRIKRVWMQKDTSGTPPASFNYGKELSTQAEMLAAQTDNIQEFHGSHTTGIAAGAGGYPNSPYVGVAPHADIVMVGGDIEVDTKIADAINYIQNYATNVGKPSVINMSFGNNMGPHDGTSNFDQYADAAIGPGKLLVSAAGNDGETPNFISHSFTSTDTVVKTFVVYGNGTLPTNGNAYIDVWGIPNQNFTVLVSLYNTVTNLYEDQSHFQIPANINAVIYDTLHGANMLPAYLKFSTGIHPQVNNKPEVLMYVNNSLQTDSIRRIVVTIKGQNTSFQMWGQEAEAISFSANGMTAPFYNGSTHHTVSDGGGCGNSTIVVGAYTSKNQWVSVNTTTQTAPSFVPVGAIAPFSAIGPTADGRTKPDITAPGNILASSFNSHFFANTAPIIVNRTVKIVNAGGQSYPFGMLEGTSMAAPMVTGILALWLQKNPALTTVQALTLMKSTAIQDGFTGAIPLVGDNTWGWGKINAFAGLTTLDIAAVNASDATNVYPNPATNELNISWSKASKATTLLLFDMTGKIVFQQQLKNTPNKHIYTINTNSLANGNYILKINADESIASFKITKH